MDEDEDQANNNSGCGYCLRERDAPASMQKHGSELDAQRGERRFHFDDQPGVKGESRSSAEDPEYGQCRPRGRRRAGGQAGNSARQR